MSIYFPFHLGTFHCASLLDGQMSYPLRNIYANVAQEEIEAVLRAQGLPVDMVTTPYSYLFVNTAINKVMVDVGAGDFAPTTGRLMESLRAADIPAETVDTVIISHAHPDHIGGMLDEQGRLNFPNARYYIMKDEWNFWFSEDAAAKTPTHFIHIARRNLAPLKERVVLVEGDCEILPGVRMIPAPGHTPGHAVVSFHSAGETLTYIADTVIQPLHLAQPGWLPVYDILPEKAAQSKRQVFDQAAAEQSLVLGQHFPPFPSLGRVSKQDSGWHWEPI